MATLTLKRSDLEGFARSMQDCIVSKDRVYHAKKYRNCFLGSDAVQWLMQHVSGTPDHMISEESAIAVGNAMLKFGLFAHVTKGHQLENAKLFYRWAPAASATASTAASPVPAAGGGESGRGERPGEPAPDKKPERAPSSQRDSTATSAESPAPANEEASSPVDGPASPEHDSLPAATADQKPPASPHHQRARTVSGAATAARVLKLKELEELAQQLRDNVAVKDRMYRFVKYKRFAREHVPRPPARPLEARCLLLCSGSGT